MSIAYPLDTGQRNPLNNDQESEQSIQERYFNEILEESHRKDAEIWRLREENAEKDEIIEKLRAGRPDSELLEDANQTIAEQRDTIEDLRAKYRYQQERNDRIELKQSYIALEHDRRKRLLSNSHLSGNQKVIFQAIENEIKAQTSDPTRLTHINLLAIEQKTGLGHNCVSKEVGRLQEYGAWHRDDTFEERVKKGKKIVVDKISLALTDLAVTSPEDIRPGAGEERNHGGKRDWCRKCGSKNTRRLYHIQCMDCGHEYVNYHNPEEDALGIIDVRSDQDDSSHVHQHTDQVDQTENVGQRTSSRPSHLKLLGNEEGQGTPAQLIQLERVADDHRHEHSPATCTTPPPLIGEQPAQAETHNQTSKPAQLIQLERVADDHRHEEQPAQLDTHFPTPISTKLQEKPIPGQKLGACLARKAYNKDGNTPQAKNHEKVAGYRACGCTSWYPIGGEEEYICSRCYSPIAWTRKIRAEQEQD